MASISSSDKEPRPLVVATTLAIDSYRQQDFASQCGVFWIDL